MRFFFIFLFSCVSFLSLQEASAQDEIPKASAKPNFIILLSDDQHWKDLFGVMPQTEERIFKQGVTFERGYVTTPLCCPSRASILTGMYSSKHGVDSNKHSLVIPTIVEKLKKEGYYTGIIGKYLNTWTGEHRPEYDYWRVFQGGNSPYFNPIFNENGAWRRKDGYIAHVISDYAQEFLELAKESGKPYFLFVTPQIPHRPAVPEPSYRAVFADFNGYRPKNFGCHRRNGKPKWIKKIPCGNGALQQKKLNNRASIRKGVKESDFQIRQRQTLLSFDDMIGRTLDTIEAVGETDKTAIFYLSDNGLLRVSFGLTGKMYQYEDSIKVPFGFKYPPLTDDAPKKISQLIANVDIAPTIFELAGLEPDPNMDGNSLVPLLARDPNLNWRTELLIESNLKGPFDGARRTPFVGLRTDRYAFFLNENDLPELYDMDADPEQLYNVVFNNRDLVNNLYNELVLIRPDVTVGQWVNKRYRSFFK